MTYPGVIPLSSAAATPLGTHPNRGEQIGDIAFDGLPPMVRQILRDMRGIRLVGQRGQLDVQTELAATVSTNAAPASSWNGVQVGR